MFKRVTIVALVVAAFVLLVAVPAMAFNGYRADYTTANACQTCHSGIAGIPAVYNEWAETKHGENEAYNEVKNRVPTGSVCQGCHTANFAPAKMTPSPSGTAWAYTTDVSQAQAVGEGAWSENVIGCSSCHYGANVTGTLAQDGVDPNDTAHTVPMGEMANADICGACHSRYSYTTGTFAITPIPTPGAVDTIQPQMALGGYKMLGEPKAGGGWNPAAPLSTVLNYPQPGWTPTPTATRAGLGNLMTYWQVPAATATGAPTDTMWQQIGHDGSAAQYPEWRSEGHANSLTALTSQPFWASFPEATKQECLECHSADYRILKEMGENPSSADVKYGITCVGCHAPHDAGSTVGVWDEEFDAQLNDDASLGGNPSNVCVECHNGELPEGTTASPGAEIHHPMKEMMDGYGAIDVSAFPSVHKGKCVQCHMPPTSWSRGSVQLGGNHTFTIIEPEVAAEEVLPIPVSTTTARATALPIPGTTNLPVVTTTITKAYSRMPYSACSTCHDNNSKPETVTTASTATATPTAAPTTVQVTVNRETMVASGDKAMWLQDTIDQRQEWTKARVEAIWAALNTAAVNLGYADTDAAHTALVAMAAAERTTAQNAFLAGFTNVEFVESEGSFGLHNWDYSREIVNKAMEQAKIAQTGVVVKLPYKVTLALSKSKIKAGAKVKFSGSVTTAKGVAAAGTAKVMKRVGGVWKVWKNAKLNASGKYSITVKMTKKGTFYFRAAMPGDSLNNAANSAKKKLVVK